MHVVPKKHFFKIRFSSNSEACAEMFLQYYMDGISRFTLTQVNDAMMCSSLSSSFVEPPFSPHSISISHVGSEDASIRWQTPFNGYSPILRYFIKYHTGKRKRACVNT